MQSAKWFPNKRSGTNLKEWVDVIDTTKLGNGQTQGILTEREGSVQLISSLR